MNRHQQYIRIVPEAETAVLFIHGIIGTPDHFRDFIPLVPGEWSIYNILLDGHGKDVLDFSQTSMKKWKDQVSEALRTLKRNHQKIVIVAHSMGTLFAIDEAVKDPENVAHLFLLASPLALFPKPIVLPTALRVLFDRVNPSNPREVGAKNAYGIAPDRRLWKYVTWIPRYLELFGEIRRTRKIVSMLNVPCTVFQSKQDELVSFSSIKILKRNPIIQIHSLPDSGHYHFSEADCDFVLKEFRALCRSVAEQKHF